MPLTLPQGRTPVAHAGQLAGQRLHPTPPFTLRRQRLQQPLSFALNVRNVGIEFRQRLLGHPGFLCQRLGARRQARTPRAQVGESALEVPRAFHQPRALRLAARRLPSGLLHLPARRRQVLLELRTPQRCLCSLPAQFFHWFGQQRRQRFGGLLLALFRGLQLPVHREQPVSSQRHLPVA